MKIESKKFVALSYELIVDGEVADKATKDQPLKFVFGQGFLLPKFESNIEGLGQGESFEFTLTPEEGYGEFNAEAVIELPMNVFEVNGQVEPDLLVVGNRIPMMTADGMHVVGVVTEVADSSVKMDFNHPMAGKVLNFTGEIVEVREATEQDYPQHSHGCDCGCDSCGDGCGDGCGEGCKEGCN